MKATTRALVALLLAAPVAACSTPPKKADLGAVLGGIGGGVIGNQVGRGHGRTVAVIAGTLLGAAVGHEVGRSVDRTDELLAARALEHNRTGQRSRWKNPDTGRVVAVTPTRTFQRPDGEYCREYQTEVWVGREKQEAYGTACRQPDGSWKIL
ncbi:MAG: RT0821/Lpp0805 family surface protein [Deferrisomatales bacterium]